MSEHEFLTHLRKDHNEQKDLGKKLSQTKEPEKREKLRQQFYESLHPHIVGEEASMFKMLTNSEDEEAKSDGLEGTQEHHVAKFILRELMNLKIDSDIFNAKATVLDELNRHHIEEEETAIFGHLNRLCDDKQLDKLFKQYKEAEEKAK